MYIPVSTKHALSPPAQISGRPSLLGDATKERAREKVQMSYNYSETEIAGKFPRHHKLMSTYTYMTLHHA